MFPILFCLFRSTATIFITKYLTLKWGGMYLDTLFTIHRSIFRRIYYLFYFFFTLLSAIFFFPDLYFSLSDFLWFHRLYIGFVFSFFFIIRCTSVWSLYKIVDPFVFPSFFFSLIRKPYLCTVTLIVKRIPRCLFRLKQLFKNLDHKWISIATRTTVCSTR